MFSDASAKRPNWVSKNIINNAFLTVKFVTLSAKRGIKRSLISFTRLHRRYIASLRDHGVSAESGNFLSLMSSHSFYRRLI